MRWTLIVGVMFCGLGARGASFETTLLSRILRPSARMQSFADLMTNHVTATPTVRPNLPNAPTPSMMREAGVWLIDPSAFDADVLEAFGTVERGGVKLHEVFAYEDPTTRERCLCGADGKPIWVEAAPAGYDPTSEARVRWPWLTSLAADDPVRRRYEAACDPARVVSRYLLLPEKQLDDYAEGVAAAWADLALLQNSPQRASIDPDAFLVTGIVRTNASSVTLALQVPPDFTNRVDLFGIESLASFPWQLLATTPPATSNTATATLAWTGSSGFFRAGDADTDTDGDGVPDAREDLMHGTDPDDGDTDGDGLPDGWEISHGLDPLADDALSDLDNDRVPAIYEFHHGASPTNADSHLIAIMRVNSLAAATNAAYFASIKAAVAASTPYSVIEVADGLYSGPNNSGLWFPAHPILLMSENWGASRRAKVSYEGNLAAFYMNARQDNRTIVRGLNLLLGGENAYQIGFWLGDGGIVAPDMGAAPAFEGVTVELGASNVNVGYFCRHSVPGTVRFENCVIRGKRGSFKPMRGIYAIDSPALRVANCTFQDFSPEPYSYGIQFESTHYNNGSADNPIDVDLVNCAWDESFAYSNSHAFVRLEQSVVYHVSLTNCLVPRALDWFPPDTQSGLIITNANLAMGGHLRSGSPAINAGFDVAPLLDFEGQTRDAAPDIGADEYTGFAAGDSDGDGLADETEVETYATNPYAADSDGDGMPDGTEVAMGSDPTDPFSFRVTVLGSATNRTGVAAPLRASYGWSEGAWSTSTATNLPASGVFVFDVFADAAYSGAWVNVFCDFDADGLVDAATEPVYSQPVIVTGACHHMAFDLHDWDGDGMPDWDEVQCGTDPLGATNYCVTLLGFMTNITLSPGSFRAGFSLTADGTAMLAETNVADGCFLLPEILVNAAGTPRVHLYDDLNGNGALDAGEVFATQTLSITGLVTAIIFDGTLAYCDKDADGMPDFWEARHGLSWTNAYDACGNPDGDGLINLHEFWSQTDPSAADGAQYALSDAALAIDNRIAGRNPTNALPIFENYLANGANGIFIRNTNCWAADLDLTCCSPWNSYLGHRMAGTLISPRHVLFAAHFDQIPTNRTLTFVDRQNNVITRTLVAKKRHPVFTPNYPDLTVGLLDSDVSTNQITFAKVLPDNYADYIRDGARLPAIRFDQEEKALVGDVRYVTFIGPPFTSTSIVPVKPTRLAFFETVIAFDSGNPAFILVNGQAVLLTLWTSGGGGSGTSVTAFQADINQLMSDLGGGYQLTEIDLTAFTCLP